MGCISQLSVTITQYLGNQLIKRKWLFWSAVLEVLILALLLWANGDIARCSVELNKAKRRSFYRP